MLTSLLDEERSSNASMSAVRATMQDHGLSISDILLLQSQNQFLQSELQVLVLVLVLMIAVVMTTATIMTTLMITVIPCPLTRRAAIPVFSSRRGRHHGQANGSDQRPAGGRHCRVPVRLRVLSHASAAAAASCLGQIDCRCSGFLACNS